MFSAGNLGAEATRNLKGYNCAPGRHIFSYKCLCVMGRGYLLL